MCTGCGMITTGCHELGYSSAIFRKTRLHDMGRPSEVCILSKGAILEIEVGMMTDSITNSVPIQWGL